MKPSRSRDEPVNQSRTAENDLDQAAAAVPEVALTPEERARLLVKLEAEFEAAERSIEEEGTISTEEFVKQRADYWADVTQSSGEKEGKAPQR